MQVAMTHEQTGKWHRAQVEMETHVGQLGTTGPSHSPKFPLSTLPAPLADRQPELLPASALLIPSLQLRCFPQRSRRFKAQDSRCTGKVGSMQPSVVLGGLGTPGHHNPDSKALQWIHTVVLGLSRHGWVRKLKKASMWNLIKLLGICFLGEEEQEGRGISQSRFHSVNLNLWFFYWNSQDCYPSPQG